MRDRRKRNESRSKPGPYGCSSCHRTFTHYAGRGIHETREHRTTPSPYILRSRQIAYLWRHTVIADECWIFTGSRQAQGSYGRIPSGAGVLPIYAHRLALELELGRQLIGDEYALHHCDNPPCVRPDHLFLGTHADNMADARAKGRTYIAPRDVATHCARGHPWTPENTMRRPTGRRRCRACSRRDSRLWREARRV